MTLVERSPESRILGRQLRGCGLIAGMILGVGVAALLAVSHSQGRQLRLARHILGVSSLDGIAWVESNSDLARVYLRCAGDHSAFESLASDLHAVVYRNERGPPPMPLPMSWSTPADVTLSWWTPTQRTLIHDAAAAWSSKGWVVLKYEEGTIYVKAHFSSGVGE